MLPSLEEFARAQGLEDFSEADQIEAYEAAYPGADSQGGGGQGKGRSQPSSRRARLIERQLEALRWLEELVAQEPRPGDSVAAWLAPSLAARLERAGLPTLFALVERINGIGARWWVPVPGVGEAKAARILEWLQAHEAVLGLRLGAHVAQPRPWWKFRAPFVEQARPSRMWQCGCRFLLRTSTTPSGCTRPLATAHPTNSNPNWPSTRLSSDHPGGSARGVHSTERSLTHQNGGNLRGTCN